MQFTFYADYRNDGLLRRIVDRAPEARVQYYQDPESRPTIEATIDLPWYGLPLIPFARIFWSSVRTILLERLPTWDRRTKDDVPDYWYRRVHGREIARIRKLAGVDDPPRPSSRNPEDIEAYRRHLERVPVSAWPAQIRDDEPIADWRR
jgi:hypothetical protein